MMKRSSYFQVSELMNFKNPSILLIEQSNFKLLQIGITIICTLHSMSYVSLIPTQPNGDHQYFSMV